ncbi:MAG: hypothetical protein DMD28_05145 [Gemmatimonadetes bacterium]|nr:MAG: hypothetical protein DMD28_05145 [Gemmatimonadota bacterium]
MPYLKLVALATGRSIEAREPVVRLGRDPGSTIVFSGDEANVVSARHAEVRHTSGGWHLVDLGSRNGTLVNGARVTGAVPLKVGDKISLGDSGPKLTVAAVTEEVAPTVAEHPAIEMRAYAVSLLHAATGGRYEGRGTRIRLGRGRECEIQLAGEAEAIVSRVHAELTIGQSGGLMIRDAGSKNGTFVNGDRVTGLLPLRLGDHITLGRSGPVLIVEGLGTAPMAAARIPGRAGRPLRGMIGAALTRAREERRRGGRRSTAFLRALAAEMGHDSRRKLRWLAALTFVLVLLLGGAVYAVYWLLSGEVAASAAQQRSAGDSTRAEAERLRQELAAARAAAAPAARVDSLRAQLESAQARTAELGVALGRAQAAVSEQLAAGEARRVAAQSEVQRLRDELAAAERRAPSPGLIDSLRHAVTAAEQQTAGVEAKLRAIRGTDFASMAQRDQGAVGLITVSLGRQYYSGSGFVISPDGYMLTNWHVVADSNNARADTIWVTMADHADARFADVIAASQPRDIALLKIRGYQGPYVTGIDWGGARARQGEPAALIGYPAGAGFARAGSRSAAVRTSMTAGIISRVTDDLIQFDGMTIGGSSGSPLFNADGEVISIHRAGLPQAPGFALSVPVKQAIPLLPDPLKQQLMHLP